MPAGEIDLFQPFRIFRRKFIGAHNVGKAEDRIHRCSYLVAHIGQKSTFCQVGLFGELRCFDQLCGTLSHQILKMMPVLIEFFTETLFLCDVLFDGHIVGDRTIRLAHRGDDRKLDILAAIFAFIVKFTLPAPALFQRLPQ